MITLLFYNFRPSVDITLNHIRIRIVWPRFVVSLCGTFCNSCKFGRGIRAQLSGPSSPKWKQAENMWQQSTSTILMIFLQSSIFQLFDGTIPCILFIIFYIFLLHEGSALNKKTLWSPLLFSIHLAVAVERVTRCKSAEGKANERWMKEYSILVDCAWLAHT